MEWKKARQPRLLHEEGVQTTLGFDPASAKLPSIITSEVVK
jgi:hypothetical protein